MDSKLWILLNLASDQVHKHSETALDTPKIEGTESSLPEKMHLIVQHKAWPSVKSHGFTDEAVKMTVPSVKWQVFTDDLKKLVLIAPFRGAAVVQKEKMFQAKRRRCSAASSASARLSKKVEAAGTPD